ncbi:hypothetical protein [Streptomyces noursei]|uniref:hypothetical protein n=1 Tax=Streptomyces noursei TaxID=1971 RepID=UPI0005CB1077
MSTTRRRPLGHGPQPHGTTTADEPRKFQPHVSAVDADVELPPMRLATGLDDDLAQYRNNGTLSPQTNI